MCGLEVPDLFKAVRDEFSREQVTLLAVNYWESASTIRDFIADTGLSEPVLMDSPGDSCHHVPGGDVSLYEHFAERVGDPADGPFPLQLVIDPSGVIVFATRFHNTQAVVDVLHGLKVSPAAAE